MAQIFHRSMNAFSRATILGFVFILAIIGWMLWVFYNSSWATQVRVVRDQPVQFSHEHHVAGLGIDCRYCHTSVEDSAFAGIPPTETCMQCHAQIWADSPKLAPVRESFRSGVSLEWTRVHDVPDFAYFRHEIHIKKGVACVTCHGPVNEMPLTWREHTLHMKWCLDCHRNPEQFVRPRDQVFSMTWTPPASESEWQELSRRLEIEPVSSERELGAALVEKYHINTRSEEENGSSIGGSHENKLTNCSICHR